MQVSSADVKFQQSYKNVLKCNISSIADYEHTNKLLVIAYLRFMQDSVSDSGLRKRFRVPDQFTYTDVTGHVNNISILQSPPGNRMISPDIPQAVMSLIVDLQLNSFLGRFQLERLHSDNVTRELFVSLDYQPRAFGMTHGNLLLGYTSGSSSYVEEIALNPMNELVTGLSKFMKMMRGYIHPLSFFLDRYSNIRVSILPDWPAFYLFDDSIYYRPVNTGPKPTSNFIITCVPSNLGDEFDVLGLPHLTVEIDPNVELLSIWTTVGVANDLLAEFETPLAAWKLTSYRDTESAGVDIEIRELADLLHIPSSVQSL